MEYIIKDFYTNGDKKYIGIIAKRDEDEVKFLIDREVSISEGKSDKDYISDAFKALGRNGLSMEYEINDFFENYEKHDKEDISLHQNVGKKWDDEKKSLENA